MQKITVPSPSCPYALKRWNAYTQKQYLELLVNGFVRGAWSVSISVELSQHKRANSLTVCGYF